MNTNVRPTPAQMKRLDGLRGVAALGVAILFHYSHFKPAQIPFQVELTKWFYTDGWSLVDLFFILSGLIFAIRYQQVIETHAISFADYMRIRIARLYPVHLLTLFLAFIAQAIHLKLTGFVPIYGNFNLYHFALNLLFIQKLYFDAGGSFNGPSWSVSVEMLLYVVFYFVCYTWRLQSIWACAVCGLVGLYLLHRGLGPEVARGILGFFGGVLFYRAFLRADSAAQTSKWRHLGCALLVAVFIVGGRADRNLDFSTGKYYIYTLFVFPIMIYLILSYALIGRIFETKPLTYVGKISYSLYMIHVPVQMSVMTLAAAIGWNYDPTSKIFFVSYASTVLGSAIVIHHLFEHPLRVYLRNPPTRRSA